MPPDAFEITKGSEHLAWTKVTEKGPVRWFTTCCNTPTANTLGSPKIPFLTLQTAYFRLPEATGAIAARVNRKGATGHIEGEMGSAPRVLWGLCRAGIKGAPYGIVQEKPVL